MASLAPNPARDEFWKQLKPCCVAIIKLATKPSQTVSGYKELTALTDELVQILAAQIQRDPTVFTDKHADYIFFPLSHILRKQKDCPQPLLERTVRVLTLLIFHGWKSKAEPQLVHQLLLLLTFIIGGTPDQEENPDVSEETTLEAFRALTALLDGAVGNAKTGASLVETSVIPAVSHGVTVALHGVVEGRSADIQVEALGALGGFFKAIRDDEALATFLPGTVSALVNVLSAPARHKRRVLVSAISTLKLVLLRVLSDIRLRSVIAKAERQEKEAEAEHDGPKTGKDGKVLTLEWLKATAAQIKIALGSVLKLRTNGSLDIQEALERLCVSLLDECHKSLANCASILLETAMVLSSDEKEQSIVETSLDDLTGIYPELADMVKVTAYNWITSLPRIMQSNDEGAKSRAIQNLMKGLAMVTKLQIDSPTLEDSVASALRDSISQALSTSKPGRVFDDVSMTDIMSGDSALVKRDSEMPQFRPVVMGLESQGRTRKEMLQLISRVGSAGQQTKLAGEMLDYARESTGVSQISSYWLSLELLRAALTRSRELDQFFDFSSIIPDMEDPESTFHDLYSYSVSVLDSHTEMSDADWRFEAIALEVTAFAASRAGEAFRPELIDVLYPIATFLGSEHPQLRHHAIITLNSLALSCGYGSVSELIIDNVDYMVNSVSLRLNTFDISPASTKVLTMMIRLSGPQVVPFLDDVVASIFAALDNYHGYPVFVEGLFGVLKEVVEQGVKSDLLLLEGPEAPKVDHRKRPKKETTISDVAEILEQRKKRKFRQEEEDRVAAEQVKKGKAHPERPWKERLKDKNPRITEISDGDEEEEGRGKKKEEPNPQTPEEEPPTEVAEQDKPPKPPTYTLLNHIASLTQHYLTSPTPTLRRNLLDLLATVSPALATDDDLFLPLVNAVWPTVLNRLYDDEPFVTVAACETLGVLCRSAGDFLSSRFKTEWWARMAKWCRRVKTEAARNASASRAGRPAIASGTSGSAGIVIPLRDGKTFQLKDTSVAPSSGLGQFAQSSKVWDSVRKLLVDMTSYVRVEDIMFDDILDLLADSLATDKEAREALEAVNADAVWLAMYDRGEVEWQPAPTVQGFTFVEMKRFGKA